MGSQAQDISPPRQTHRQPLRLSSPSHPILQKIDSEIPFPTGDRQFKTAPLSRHRRWFRRDPRRRLVRRRFLPGHPSGEFSPGWEIQNGKTRWWRRPGRALLTSLIFRPELTSRTSNVSLPSLIRAPLRAATPITPRAFSRVQGSIVSGRSSRALRASLALLSFRASQAPSPRKTILRAIPSRLSAKAGTSPTHHLYPHEACVIPPRRHSTLATKLRNYPPPPSFNK